MLHDRFYHKIKLTAQYYCKLYELDMRIRSQLFTFSVVMDKVLSKVPTIQNTSIGARQCNSIRRGSSKLKA